MRIDYLTNASVHLAVTDAAAGTFPWATDATDEGCIWHDFAVEEHAYDLHTDRRCQGSDAIGADLADHSTSAAAASEAATEPDAPGARCASSSVA